MERNRIALAGPVTTQIEIAVLEPGLLACLLVELERQRSALPQHGQRRRIDFDLARGDFGVGVALRPDLDDTFNGDAELRTQPVRVRQHVGIAEHHLRYA